MAIGYEKLNTSAARSKRARKEEIPRGRISVVDAGAKIWNSVYGFGETLEAFVSDSDKVKCEFEGGFQVMIRGGAVRVFIRDREKKNL